MINRLYILTAEPA